jgi:hypothetical protein
MALGSSAIKPRIALLHTATCLANAINPNNED